MKLTKAEIWAIVLTAAFLAAAAGGQLGARRRVPAFTVAAREETATVGTPSPETAEAGARMAGPAASAASDGLVDLNAAGAEELKTLSGIGDVLAGRIVAYREENGPFRRVEELTKVNGIGMKILEDNIERLTVGTEGEAA